MDLNDIPLFVRIIESGSFSAAADELGLQRSSVSRSLARLEQELGVRLLQRTTRRVALTDAGQALYERVRGAIAGVDDALNAVREFGTEPRGNVRLSALPDNEQFNLPQIIRDFMQQYPAIRIEVTMTPRLVDLVAEGFDLAIRAGQLPDSTLVARRLGAVPFALFAAPSYLKRAGVPKSLGDLERHECLLFRARGSKSTWSLSGPKGDESVEVYGNLSTDDMIFLLRSCIAGGGVALLPVALAREAAVAGSVQIVLPRYHMTVGSLYVVLPTSTFVPSRVALLRDHLVARLERELADAHKDCTGKKPS
jgi:DNA-binding transcriptional LysR family regulator